MSVSIEKGDRFAFTPANRTLADAHIAKYPNGRQASAVMPLLTLAQEQKDIHNKIREIMEPERTDEDTERPSGHRQ